MNTEPHDAVSQGFSKIMGINHTQIPLFTGPVTSLHVTRPFIQMKLKPRRTE